MAHRKVPAEVAANGVAEPMVQERDQDSGEARAPAAFPVVGVGASAGGLEALKELLTALPGDPGMAFVVVQHLDPTHPSMLTEILRRSSRMPVDEVEDKMLVQPNRVYVIPPGVNMIMAKGVLELSTRSSARGLHRQVDDFLRSIAKECGHKAIGVILSGTASDGTVGCEEIKAEGGITFAQDDSAQQQSMPRSAVAAGCVDFVLSPQRIAEEITRIGQHPYLLNGKERNEPDSPEQSNIDGILDAIRNGTGVDFSNYKRNTLLRRINRRMVLHRIDAVPNYVEMVAHTPGELESLFQDILINVTSFFRNPEAFDAIKAQVFPRIVAGRSRHVPVRIWVLGCSTGEEAYSLAIAFSEFAEQLGRAVPVQIFASDLNGAGIEKARAGIYSKAIAQDLSPERLRRWFVDADGSYRIAKSIRDMVVFARHNVLSDPPFSHIDLITCRNLMIYLDPVLQQRLIPILHYGLQANGYLWLGASETVGSSRNLFDTIDPKQRIYHRKPGVSPIGGFTHPQQAISTPAKRRLADRLRDPETGVDPQRDADRLLLSRYAPAGVLINGDFDVISYRGNTGAYLSPAPGRASLNLLKMLREGLIVGVRSAVQRAKRDGIVVRQNTLQVHTEAGLRNVTIEVIPIKAPSEPETCFMVTFDDSSAARDREEIRKPVRSSKLPHGERADAEIERLRQELVASREYLQSVIEQQELANEGLQAANEEIQSANEELQSINEELETSKEEIQSSSEELATVNDELNNRNTELTQSNNDLMNLVASVQLAIVMLGPDLRIRRFTPAAERLLNLINTDVGRPIGHIKLNLELDDLEPLLEQVMETVQPLEREIVDHRGHWYSLRIRPYRTLDNKIDGAVMVLVDVDAAKQAEEALRAHAERLTVMQDQAPLGIHEVDRDGRYIRVNDHYCGIVGEAGEALLGRSFLSTVHPEDRPAALRDFESVRDGAARSYHSERRCVRPDGAVIWVETHGFSLRGADGRPEVGVAFMQDITERKEVEAALHQADTSKTQFLATLAHELRNPLAPLRNIVELLRNTEVDDATFDPLKEMLDRQISNIARLVDDLLDVSRISHGKIALRIESVEMQSLMLRAVRTFQLVADSREQRIDLDMPKKPIYVDADPLRIEQVIANLLTNASKFSPHGTTIRVGLAKIAGEQRVELRIRDEGIGIDAETMPQIFEPFKQGTHDYAERRGGLGIGLTLVRKLVELHRGTVEAHSAGDGQGTELVVRLPLGASRPDAPAAVTTPPKRTSARKILVVDDNADAGDSLAMLLRLDDHAVEVVHDAETALEAAGNFRPTVLILDIGLPGMDGYQLIGKLRKLDGLHDAHFIALTGYGLDEDRTRAAAAGFNEFLVKPVDFQVLRGLIAGVPRRLRGRAVSSK